MYQPGDTSIENSGPITVIKQQWLLLQQKNIPNIHPHDVAINDLIVAVKSKQKYCHEIIVTIYDNKPFVNAKGGIAQLCDPLTHRHNLPTNISTYIRGTKQIDYILVSFNILKTLIQCGITAFNELTTNDHRGIHLDLSYSKVMAQKVIPLDFIKKNQRKEGNKSKVRSKDERNVNHRPTTNPNPRRRRIIK